MILPAFSVFADKPLKKRKQDSYPQESETMDGASVQVSNSDSTLTPKKTISASNGGTRPALMVSIDLEKAGRLIGQPVVVLDSKSLCEDHRLHVKSDRKADRTSVDNKTESSKQHVDNLRRPASDSQAESPRVSQERPSDTKKRQDGNDRGPGENKRQEVMIRPKHNRHSDKNHDGHQLHASQPETAKSASKADSASRYSEEKVRERNKDADRHQNKERIKDREVVKDRDRVVEKERHKDRNEQKNTDKDRDKNKIVDKNRNRDKDRERSKNLEMDEEIGRNVEIDKERIRDKHEDKARERNKTTEIERCRDKKRDKEIEKDRERSKNTDIDRGKDRNTDKEIDKSRERNKNADLEKDTERNRDKEISRDRNKEDRNKDRDLDRTRNKDKERSRDKDRERDRNVQTCRESSHRQSPNKLDGTAGKPERSRKPIDGQNRPRTDNPGREGGNSRDPGVSCPAKGKETKAVEFPAYLLGGKSGSLKNFVIPKLPRDSKDPQLSNKLRGGWVEPLVRLERVSLVESLKNKALPTVTLQRLSADEVRRIIREGREAQRSKPRKWSHLNKPQQGETTLKFEVWSLRHMTWNPFPLLLPESSLYECQNKRKHEVVSKRSKYVELDSDESEAQNQTSSDDECKCTCAKECSGFWECCSFEVYSSNCY